MELIRIPLAVVLLFIFLSTSVIAQTVPTQGVVLGGGSADSKIPYFRHLKGSKLYAENAVFDVNTMQFDYALNYGGFRVVAPMIETPSGQLFHLCNGPSNGQDIFLMNVNANGTINWTKQISSNGFDRFYRFVPKFSDTISIVGWHSAGGDKPMLIQTDLNGNVILNKMFNYGSDDQLSNNCIADKGGSITICSWDFSEGFYLTNISATGFVNWCRRFNPSIGGLVVAPRNFLKTPDDGYIVVCYRRNHGTLVGDEGIVVKIDNTLNVEWAKVISFPGATDFGIYHRLNLDNSDGDIYFQTNSTKLPGTTFNSSVLIKMNAAGDVIWAKVPTDDNSNLIPKNVQIHRYKDRIVIAGHLGPLSTMGLQDMMIVSTDTSFSSCHLDVAFQSRNESWTVSSFSPIVSDVNFNPINSTAPSTNISYNQSIPYCSPPLPLDLLYFDAKPLNTTDAILNWETANEEDLLHFNIQRSENGIDWTTIDQVTAQGTVGNSFNYQYRDQGVYLLGTGKVLFYYRLQVKETTGGLDYSEVRTVLFNSPEMEGTVTIQPNPTSDSFEFILYKSPGAIEGTVFEVVDVAGRVLIEEQVTSQRTVVDLSDVSAGVYFVRFYKNGLQNFRPQKVVVYR